MVETINVNLGDSRWVSSQPGDEMFEETGSNSKEEEGLHEYDRSDMRALWSRLMGFYAHEIERQHDNRINMHLNEEFYDNIQWTAEEVEILESRGQQALIYNAIAPAVDWMLGTEKRGRTDAKLLPRSKEGSKAAKRKTGLMKYLADVNDAEFAISDAFAECVKGGLGVMETGVQEDTEDEPIYERAESWRNILHDSTDRGRDWEGCRYIFRTKWTDSDDAIAMFPKRANIIKTGVNVGSLGSFDYSEYGDQPMDQAEDEYQNTGIAGAEFHHAATRYRLKLYECWFKRPVETERIKGGEFSGELFDEHSPGHVDALNDGSATIAKKPTMRVYVMIFTETGILWYSESPYRHNRYPFTPIWCKRYAHNGLPYSFIELMRDPQRDTNKRMSKAQHILNTSKVVMDKGAIAADDMDNFLSDVHRPDAVIEKVQGFDLDIENGKDIAAPQLEQASRNIAMIQSMSGITDENMGRTTNATSGKAIIARQDQGGLTTASIFDNLRYARQKHGSKKLSLIEQFMKEEKKFRITNQRGVPTFENINDGLPENDILRTKADYIISEDDWNATLRQSQADELMDLLTKLAPVQPEMVVGMLDLLVDMMDAPQREELVARIRKINGQMDPDAPEEEQVAAQQAQDEAAGMQQEQMQRMSDAEITEKEAKAQKASAEAIKAMQNLPADQLDIQKKALELAIQMLERPTAAPVADTLMAATEPAEQPAAMPA